MGYVYDMLGRDDQFNLDLSSSLDNNAVLRRKNADGALKKTEPFGPDALEKM